MQCAEHSPVASGSSTVQQCSPQGGTLRFPGSSHRPAPAPRANAHARIDTGGLIEAGTVILNDCIISDELLAAACSVDGNWLPLERGTIVQPRAANSTESHSSNVDRILALQDGDAIRATVSAKTVRAAAVPAAAGNTVLVRMYLIPADDNLPGASKIKRDKLASALVMATLGLVRVDGHEWDTGLVGGECATLLEEEDKRSLLELYRAVDSPDPSHGYVDNLQTSAAIKTRLHGALDEAHPALNTVLFPYQLASVIRMLSKELCPQLVPSPTYRSVGSVDGCETYWLSHNGHVRRQAPLVREPIGGILAEEMGSGKTLISLTLILLTLGELPSLEGVSPFLDGSPGDVPPLLTAISRKWPTVKAREENVRARWKVPRPLPGTENLLAEAELREYQLAVAREEAELSAPKPWRLPTLRELCLDLIKTTSLAVPRDAGLPDELELEMAQVRPSYILHPSPAQLNTRQGRSKRIPSQEILVCPTTIVVVPPGLVRQWLDEIKTHLASDALKVLTLTKPSASFAAEEIASHDVVLMSATVFAAAADEKNDNLRALRRVHVKRLVVDEGHVLSGTNNTKKLAEDLRCESRWAVSGTPTNSLRSAHDSDESLAGSASGSEADFNKLGNLVSTFLRHAAFPDTHAWRAAFTVPILAHNVGQSRLLGVLNSVVVKNQPSETQRNHPLPKLIKETVFLEMEPGAERKMYNALLALFVINDVTSQRKDEDWFFHQKNAKYCDELSVNLSASSFFFTSTTIADTLVKAVDNAKEAQAAEKAQTWSVRDHASIDKAVSVIEEALEDEEWKQVTLRQHVQVELDGLDGELFDQLGGLPAAGNEAGERDLISFGGLVTLRGLVNELRKTTVEGAPNWTDDEELQEEVITALQQMRREVYKPPKPVPHKPLKPIPDDSSLRSIKMGSTTSAKLNWIINEVKTHAEDKFIIFSSALPDLVFAAISEAFDMHAISHEMYTSHTSADKRSAASFRFQHSTVKDCQAILVDAKLGGRGINLTAARRVVFLEPIWQADMLVQAEKRAHRLGQTHDVIQKTLVVRGSWEDEVRRRRVEMGASGVASKKAPQRDEKLGEVLRSARWLEPTPVDDDDDTLDETHEDWTSFRIEMPADRAVSGVGKRGRKRAGLASSLAGPSPGPSPEKKRRRFAPPLAALSPAADHDIIFM